MLFCFGHKQVNGSNLTVFSVTLWFTGGILAIAVFLGQFVITDGAALSAALLTQTVAIGALCGLMVDALRYLSTQLSLETYRSLKRKRVGKDMRRLLERSLGTA